VLITEILVNNYTVLKMVTVLTINTITEKHYGYISMCRFSYKWKEVNILTN